ncbi:MAG: hypothetical protein JXB10_06655 [Pirellulales bacterium]|nr:hypothetical protein [Pirellulales bacterium]
MPAKYQNGGIAFQYPENWTLEDDVLAGNRAVTVSSPGGGFWSAAVLSRLTDPYKLAASILETMKTEYEGLEVEEIQEHVAGQELSGYDLNFFFLDLTNTAHIRWTRCNDAVYAIFCQAEDREYEQIARVFQAMTVSLLTEISDLRESES